MVEKKWMLRTVGLMLAGICAVSFVGCDNKMSETQEQVDAARTTSPKELAKQEKQRRKAEKKRRKAEKKRYISDFFRN